MVQSIASILMARKHQLTTNNSVTYLSLLSENENFRWFLLSNLITVAGEWLSYVASIAAIEQIHSSSGTISRTSISILVIIRLLPSSLFAPIGGLSPIHLIDAKPYGLGAVVAWLYVLSCYLESILALYLATLPTTNDSDCIIRSKSFCHCANTEKAMILVSSAYELMQAVGSSVGGMLTGFVGTQYCFIIDSLSYLVSALFIWKISGKYNPKETNEAPEVELDSSTEGEDSWFSLSNFMQMTKEGISYLISQSWGAFVLLKFFAALIYGVADVLNVSFSEQGENSSEIDVGKSSQRLGILFAFVGVGCVLGPIIIEPFTRMEEISSLERACLMSFFLMALGYYGLWQFDKFILICIFSSVRSAGANIVWVYSSLLLQKLSSERMRGRVFGVDYALAMLSESASALLAGVLLDDKVSAAQISLIWSIVAFSTLAVWGIYFSRVGTIKRTEAVEIIS